MMQSDPFNTIPDSFAPERSEYWSGSVRLSHLAAALRAASVSSRWSFLPTANESGQDQFARYSGGYCRNSPRASGHGSSLVYGGSPPRSAAKVPENFAHVGSNASLFIACEQFSPLIVLKTDVSELLAVATGRVRQSRRRQPGRTETRHRGDPSPPPRPRGPTAAPTTPDETDTRPKPARDETPANKP